MDIRGVFLHFNTECLRQAEDIQSFVDGPRLVDCKKETYAEILLRHVDRNLIPLEERSTYNSMNSAKAKTFRVVQLALSTTNRFRPPSPQTRSEDDLTTTKNWDGGRLETRLS